MFYYYTAYKQFVDKDDISAGKGIGSCFDGVTLPKMKDVLEIR